MSGRPKGSGRASATPGPSQAGSRAASQAGSPSRGPAPPSEAQKAKGIDPGRGRPPLTPAQLVGKRVDLPADAYKKDNEETRFTARPGYSTDGTPIKIQLNVFPVMSWIDKDVYQYDISLTRNDKDSNALVKKVWNSKTATEELGKKGGGMWLYDGSKLAWSSEKIKQTEIRIPVDLDSAREKGAQADNSRARHTEHVLVIKQTTKIRLSYLKAYLEGKISWDSHVLECMNFFDHCLRQFPSKTWITIKRNFYDPMFPVGHLGNDLVVNQGVYCAPRLSESIQRGGTGLTVNVDRSQTAFWPVEALDQLAIRILSSQKEEWQGLTVQSLASALRPIEKVDDATGRAKIDRSGQLSFLRRLTNLRFNVNHKGRVDPSKVYTIKALTFNEKFGLEGANAYTVTFKKTLEDGSEKEVSVYDHYVQRWDVHLQRGKLPLVETKQGNYFPMELCTTIQHQRYLYKLNPRQTSDMIKHAATRPSKRRSDIMEGVTHLKWNQDPYLKAFGIKIDSSMLISQARLLASPEVTFANSKVTPGFRGRWDLRGKKFLEPNASPLKSWGFISCGGERTCRQQDLENFARQFSNIYRNHGGNVAAHAYCGLIEFGEGGYEKLCNRAFETIKEFCGGNRPQIIFFVIPTKNQLVYESIKKAMDCTYNIVSQCLQNGHVRKAQPQYMSNVAMKVNSKLGGVTCRVLASPDRNLTVHRPPFWTRPTMMIGVDVSHGAPGSGQPSMAALTMSMDKHATRFAAACESNGWRQENVIPKTMHSMLPRLARQWRVINSTMPQHVYYLRDGVSEGQFQEVLDTEVREMRRIFREQGCGNPRFTVIIATKRHHVRFFPKPGDRATGDGNGNPLPGTLVERDVTHPQHFDFYLCSHVAIQGTSRPVHYQVILDEAGVKPNDLVKMIYQQCYQYCRSTTPVSLHPAVYYSHLASNRARSHENLSPEDRIMAFGKPGFPYVKDSSEIYDESEPEEAPPLLNMEAKNVDGDVVRFMNTTMWYV